MKKFFFRYGSMMSGKSTELLCVAKNYELQLKKSLILKPFLENATPDWNLFVESRMGQRRLIDYQVKPNEKIDPILINEPIALLVDEAQFLSSFNVENLRDITLKGATVICYGLRTNYRGELFEGSKRLMELADSIEEIKTVCWYCENKATMVLRLKGGNKEVEVEEKGQKNYVPTCYECWKKQKGTIVYCQ